MLTLEQVVAYHKKICADAQGLIERKGKDYSGAQRDTLFNLRVAELLGITPTAEKGILVRLSDKFMRLVSLMEPGVTPQNESLRDTVVDIINYSIYALQLHEERCAGLVAAQLQRNKEQYEDAQKVRSGAQIEQAAALRKPTKVTTTTQVASGVDAAKDYTLVPGGNFDY